MERILVCSSLDTLLTEQAVPKISEETIDYLEELLKKMDIPELSSDEYSTLNVEFHSVIYAASELDIHHRINEANLGLFKLYWKSRYFIFKRKKRAFSKRTLDDLSKY